MTESKANLNAVAIDEEKVKISSSAYDSITEVITHSIKHFQELDKFFKSKVAEKGYSMFSFCYPTALLNYAKTGPCDEACKVRADILKEISDRMQRVYEDYHCYTVHELLDDLNMQYPFICKRKYCEKCRCQFSYNYHSLNLLELSRDSYVWKGYSVMQALLDRYFGDKTKRCSTCKRDCNHYFVGAGPLLCINVEIFYECFFESVADHPDDRLYKVFCSKMVRTSLDNLPLRLTIQDGVYALFGVIERRPGEKEQEHHYAAYCRNPDNKWEKRDGLEGVTKELTELSVDSIALVFYGFIGSWYQVERKLLLEAAKLALTHLANIDLPDLCSEGILSFLDNKLLKVLIESVEEKGLQNDFTLLPAKPEQDNISVYSFDSTSSEYEEQHLRLRNVVINNLPVNDGVSDVESVKSLFDGIPSIDLDNIRVHRYREQPKNCKFPNTVVTFRSRLETEIILHRRKSFSESIKIRPDYTAWQKSQCKKLKSIAKKHNKANPNAQKIVKYIGGVPTLVNKKNNFHPNAKSSSTTSGCSEVSESSTVVAKENKR